MIDWLIDRLTDWLTDFDWLIDWCFTTRQVVNAKKINLCHSAWGEKRTSILYIASCSDHMYRMPYLDIRRRMRPSSVIRLHCIFAALAFRCVKTATRRATDRQRWRSTRRVQPVGGSGRCCSPPVRRRQRPSERNEVEQRRGWWWQMKIGERRRRRLSMTILLRQRLERRKLATDKEVTIRKTVDIRRREMSLLPHVWKSVVHGGWLNVKICLINWHASRINMFTVKFNEIELDLVFRARNFQCASFPNLNKLKKQPQIF